MKKIAYNLFLITLFSCNPLFCSSNHADLPKLISKIPEKKQITSLIFPKPTSSVTHRMSVPVIVEAPSKIDLAQSLFRLRNILSHFQEPVENETTNSVDNSYYNPTIPLTNCSEQTPAPLIVESLDSSKLPDSCKSIVELNVNTYDKNKRKAEHLPTSTEYNPTLPIRVRRS